jgi:hypothetical protein
MPAACNCSVHSGTAETLTVTVLLFTLSATLLTRTQ